MVSCTSFVVSNDFKLRFSFVGFAVIARSCDLANFAAASAVMSDGFVNLHRPSFTWRVKLHLNLKVWLHDSHSCKMFSCIFMWICSIFFFLKIWWHSQQVCISPSKWMNECNRSSSFISKPIGQTSHLKCCVSNSWSLWIFAWWVSLVAVLEKSLVQTWGTVEHAC